MYPTTGLRTLAAAVACSSLLIPSIHAFVLRTKPVLNDQLVIENDQDTTATLRLPRALQDVLDTLETMQDSYFDRFAGTWPDSIDWTAAVMGTHISATLGSIVDSLDSSMSQTCSESMLWDDILNQYYMQTSFFYFGENTFGLRNQAYDDMLWVVLGWLESIKFADTYAHKKWSSSDSHRSAWHGLQFSPMAAHRARIFYELASTGWDTSLCDGGMVWNSHLTPYKNAITNELYAAASIGMYLYFPGDNNSAPFMSTQPEYRFKNPYDPIYLENAVKTYKWLKESNMQSSRGLFQDGFHIHGWRHLPNGTIDPGTGQCDELNTMVYTYNQGVLLSAQRGLWLATGARSYLEDGHDLIGSVIRATGWPESDRQWHGLGRGGVLEEYCDHRLDCSQDGQTFKGIFFHHLAEFCRPLRPHEEAFVSQASSVDFDEGLYHYHLARCAAYGKWIENNAAAARDTMNEDGLFGMWWGASGKDACGEECDDSKQPLPPGAVDYLNPPYEVHDLTYGDINDRGRGRTVETQGGGLAVLRANWQWKSFYV